LIDHTVGNASGIVATLGSNGIEFIEEQDTRSRSFGTLEQITDRLFGRADVLVEDFGAFDGDEVEATFTRYGGC
jgi:hypothetical protein